MIPGTLSYLHVTHGGIWISDGKSEPQALSRGEAIARATDTPLVLLNAPLIGARLGYPELSGLDLLELFAFIHPARFAVPTPGGMATALGLSPPKNDSQTPLTLRAICDALLSVPDRPDWPERSGAWSNLQSLTRLRWAWTPILRSVLRAPKTRERNLFSALPVWEEQAPRPNPRSVTLTDVDVTAQLDAITGHDAETRSGQQAYARAVAAAFVPRVERGVPRLVLAEGGTGIGKTLGYLAPASLWAAMAEAPVWVSTYTRALQRQLDAETRRIYPPGRGHVAIRKGRENYLCLLNLEDAMQGGFAGRAAVLAQLVARWAAYTRDGDMVGGDLPGWLPSLFRRNGSTALTDRRGECVYAGCPHYRACFIERAARASEHAQIVIANHALVMINAARGRDGASGPPTRYIFDEGHHLFDAADSTFSAALTGQEAIELRRWIIGPEGKSRGRRRGLAARLSDVASYDAAGAQAMADTCAAAQQLAGDDWLRRIADGSPYGAIERLLHAVRSEVYARASDAGNDADAGYGLETEIAEPSGPLVEAAGEAAAALDAIHAPLMRLARRLEAILDDPPDWLDAQARARIDGALSALGWRADLLSAWIALLGRIGGAADPDFVDWLTVERVEGREYDIGIRRHWLDPTRPLARVVMEPAHGIVVTSATLGAEGEWAGAIARTGAAHLPQAPVLFSAHSPFDYANRSEVIIVTDVKRGDLPALAAAYARLIEASQGGALGLFTAIRRLRAVHARIADRLARSGLPLYAQHVDPMDTGTLIDIFRDEAHASLLGTDALRDGVDVPGHSLRLVMLEGVPWPKPTVLHAARKLAGGGQSYDDAVIRARLAQAFGRLIRRADDQGMFVILSAAMPSRLLDAFPAGVPVRRLPLDEAVLAVSERLGSFTKIGQSDATTSRPAVEPQ